MASNNCVIGSLDENRFSGCSGCGGNCFPSGKLKNGVTGCTYRCGSANPSHADTVNPTNIGCSLASFQMGGSAVSTSDICKDNWVCRIDNKCYKYFSGSIAWSAANTQCASKLFPYKKSHFFNGTSEMMQIEASICQELANEKYFFIPECLFKI